MAKIYVAGKFEDKENVRKAQRGLIAAGHTISHDWTSESVAGKEGQGLAEYLKECAMTSYEGVMVSDMVLLLNHEKCFGTMVELGLALAWGRVCFIVNPKARENIFYNLPVEMGMRLFETVDEAIDAINEAELNAGV